MNKKIRNHRTNGMLTDVFNKVEEKAMQRGIQKGKAKAFFIMNFFL